MSNKTRERRRVKKNKCVKAKGDGWTEVGEREGMGEKKENERREGRTGEREISSSPPGLLSWLLMCL